MQTIVKVYTLIAIVLLTISITLQILLFIKEGTS